MAMDERLEAVKRRWVDAYGTDDYDKVFEEYLDVLKVVAVERGEGVLGYELPADCIGEFAMDGEFDWVDMVMKQFARMIEALEEVHYESLDSWVMAYRKTSEFVEYVKEQKESEERK